MAAISELGVKYGDRVVFENFSLEMWRGLSRTRGGRKASARADMCSKTADLSRP